MMTTIHLKRTTTATPEQFVAALTHFGPGRDKLFPRSTDGYLKVHSQGPSHADVTEGSSTFWERLHYDWSDPHRVVLTTVDSNVWGGTSGHIFTFTPGPDGTTSVEWVVVRKPKNIKGRVVELVIALRGRQFLGSRLDYTINAVEARSTERRNSERRGASG
jgi:hypothetical protein